MEHPLDLDAQSPACRPGSLQLRLRLLRPGAWRWSCSYALADQPPTEAPLLATGVLTPGETEAVSLAVHQAISRCLGSDPELWK